jgi:hypothetical protein
MEGREDADRSIAHRGHPIVAEGRG